MFTVPSPCTGVCTLDAANVCIGCGRRLDEIAEWSQAPNARRQRIVELAAARRAERQAHVPPPESK